MPGVRTPDNERVKRRSVLMLAALGMAMPSLAFSQLSVLALRLVRPAGWRELLERNQCVVDELYVTQPSFPRANPGRKLCLAMERPWRSTLPQVPIPAGDYAGVVMRDGALGWRIELSGTGAARDVQLQVGNKPVSTSACILVAMGNAASCAADSMDAIRALRQEYGETDSRPVLLRIQA
jgi:hypothetical protein